MLRYAIFCCLTLFAFSSNAQWVVEGKIIHPEQIIRDYQADETDYKEWFESKKPEFSANAIQRAYIIKKLRDSAHGEAFRNVENFTADKSQEWAKLKLKVYRLFKNKKHGKEYLALFCIKYGDNILYEYKQPSELLPIDRDEYFVAPVSAIESYRWPKGNIEKYYFKENELANITVTAANRPHGYDRRYIRSSQSYTYYDVSTFSDSTRKNLRYALGDEDLYNEVLEMGKLENSFHELLYGGKRSLMINSDDWRVMEKIYAFAIASFNTDKGESIEVVHCPYIENDEMMNQTGFSRFRGSTNRLDCYYFIKAGTSDDIGPGNDIAHSLAHIFRKAKDNYNGWDQPMRGLYQGLTGYCCMGYMSADGYPHAFISQNRSTYFLSNGVSFNREEAEKYFKKTIDDLDQVDIVKYGKLTKDAFMPEEKEKDSPTSSKSQIYHIYANGMQFAVNATLIKFSEKFYLTGIEIIKL